MLYVEGLQIKTGIQAPNILGVRSELSHDVLSYFRHEQNYL